MGAEGEAGSTPVVLQRIETALRAAASRDLGVSVAELADLLPDGAPASEPELVRWLRRRPQLAQVTEDRALLPGRTEDLEDVRARQLRGVDYVDRAHDLVRRTLRATSPWLLTAGVTGSTAYGGPQEGEDCDLFVVTRRGALWAFLTYTYLRLRWRDPQERPTGSPVWCLNFVLDDPTARNEFGRERGFLFAREALTVRPITGEEYYRGLLARGSWLQREAPRLYARWNPIPAAPPPARTAPWPMRLLNLALYPWVASYLQLVGLLRNHSLRRTGRAEEIFVTETRPGRLAIHSVKFDRLRQLYRGTSVTEPSPGKRPLPA